jgi:hypothetical protein
MELKLSQDDFKEITKLLPQLLRNKLIGSYFVPSVFKALEEELTMEDLLDLFAELFSSKYYKGKSFSAPSEIISHLANENELDGVQVGTFLETLLQIEYFVKRAVDSYNQNHRKLPANINLMMDDHKNEIIDKVIYDRIRPFENLRTVFNMRYAFISGAKDKEALYEDIKGQLGPWLQAKIKDPQKMTVKEFNLYCNSKTLKTDKLFAELL